MYAAASHPPTQTPTHSSSFQPPRSPPTTHPPTHPPTSSHRDCHARASNGEICCAYKPDGTCDYEAPGDCKEGLKTYMTEYIDPIVEVLEKYQHKVPIALIIEPDSLPNLATNAGDPRCGSTATKTAYTEGVKYAVKQIGEKVSLFHSLFLFHLPTHSSTFIGV